MAGQTKQTTFIHVAALLTVAFSIRVYLWLKVPHVIFMHEADGIGYIGIARNILENLSISNSTHFPPFYPLVIAVFSLIIGNYETGARVASLCAGACMVVPLYLACRYIMTARSAFCAALFASLLGTFVDYSLQPLSQATYTGLIALGVWLGMCIISAPSRLLLAAFGTVSAALYLTRPEGIVFFAVNLPVLLYVVLSAGRDVKDRIFNGLTLSAGFLLPFAWYVVNLRQSTGAWTISGKSGVTSIGIDASMKLLTDGKTYGESMAGTAGLASLIPSLHGFLTTYLTQLGRFSRLVYASLPQIMLLIALIGVSRAAFEFFRHDRSGRIRLLCRHAMFASPLAMLLPVPAFDKIAVSAGYILPFYIVLIGYSALGLGWIESSVMDRLGKSFQIPESGRRTVPLAVTACVVISWFLLKPLYQEISSKDFSFMSGQQGFLLRQTGHWLAANTAASAKIMARWSNIGYYSQREWTGLVDGSIEEVTGYARRHGITHIVIDSDSVPRRRPKLADLLDPASPHSGLTPLYADQQFNTRVIVYKVQ